MAAERSCASKTRADMSGIDGVVGDPLNWISFDANLGLFWGKCCFVANSSVEVSVQVSLRFPRELLSRNNSLGLAGPKTDGRSFLLYPFDPSCRSALLGHGVNAMLEISLR